LKISGSVANSEGTHVTNLKYNQIGVATQNTLTLIKQMVFNIKNNPAKLKMAATNQVGKQPCRTSLGRTSNNSLERVVTRFES
jgi:hypothetical protein